MANSTRLSCFDLLLAGGFAYLFVKLNSQSKTITCDVPIVGWQFTFYCTIIALRVALLIYCVSLKLARCAIVAMLGFLLPLLMALTIAGQVLFSRIRYDDQGCYPEDASPWSMIFCLSIGWFLTYIYIILGCSALYRRLESTPVRFFFAIYTHLSRNDPILLRLAAMDEDDEERERINDAFEPLNQSGQLDESFVPLTPRELNVLTDQKADKSIIEEVCSICCDNFEEKQKIRSMPVCEHKFHKQCIDKWLQKKPICPNCNRNVRVTGNIGDVEDYLL